MRIRPKKNLPDKSVQKQLQDIPYGGCFRMYAEQEPLYMKCELNADTYTCVNLHSGKMERFELEMLVMYLPDAVVKW